MELKRIINLFIMLITDTLVYIVIILSILTIKIMNLF